MATKKKETTAKRKNVKRTRPKAKAKASIKEMKQTHGMEEGETFEKTTLDQIWGDTGMDKYGTHNEEEYTLKIKSMNRSDLHSHAVKMGILPVDNRELLTTRLTREFRKYLLAFQKPKRTDTEKAGKRVSKRSRSILAEGR